jgi:hypothetical protein
MGTNVTSAQPRARDWTQEYAALALSDRDLPPEDLERYAIAAHLLGSPVTPDYAGELTPDIRQLHSLALPEPAPDGRNRARGGCRQLRGRRLPSNRRGPVTRHGSPAGKVPFRIEAPVPERAAAIALRPSSLRS